MLLQETWLQPKNIAILGDLHDDYGFSGTSAIDEQRLLTGRPYGGTAVLWRKELNRFVTHVESECKRITAITLCLNNRNLLIISCYLPCDNYSNHDVADEFSNVYDAIEVLIAQMPDREVILGGDMNIDAIRNNAHYRYYDEFLNRCGMSDLWNVFPCYDRFTFFDLFSNARSCIDHWAVTIALSDVCIEADVCHEATNPSKHSAIYMSIPFEHTRGGGQRSDYDRTDHSDKVNWNLAPRYTNAYRNRMNQLLNSRRERHQNLVMCRDVKCTSSQHRTEIDSWCQELVDIALSADSVFPRKRPYRRVLCGWNEYVKPYRDECKFWYDLWSGPGAKERSGYFFDRMREAKRQCMYAVRRTKRRQVQLKEERFAEALARGSPRDFYKEARKQMPGKPTTDCINGIVGDDDIAEHFRQKYNALYCSVPSEASAMQRVERRIQEAMGNCDMHEMRINVEEITSAVRKLKHLKKDGDVGYNSSHLLYTSSLYYQELSDLFTAIYLHGYQPEVMLKGTICSIPKDGNKSLKCDGNYRGICLCSALSKLLEHIFIGRNEKPLVTSDMQYAFKRGMGTTTCTMMLKEVARYYADRRSTVYCCLLDATKAFDRLRYDKLFELLLERGVRMPDLRLLFDCYTRQKLRASWRGSMSDYFSIENGIRQGGIASPTLFCLYLDQLLFRLKEAGYGCWVGPRYFGCLSYADDITLLSPSKQGLQRMLQICEDFCHQSDLQFNAQKSMAMTFGIRLFVPSPLMLNDSPISWVPKARHLGNIISQDMGEAAEIETKKGDLIGRTNLLCGAFSHQSNFVKNKLFQSQCCHLYGCQAWQLHDSAIERFVTTQNRCTRRVLCVPPRTHRRLLPVLTGRPPCLDRVVKIARKNLASMCACPNHNVSFVARAFLRDQQSMIGKNSDYVNHHVFYEPTIGEVAVGAAINELINEPPVFFSANEAREFAHWLCVC